MGSLQRFRAVLFLFVVALLLLVPCAGMAKDLVASVGGIPVTRYELDRAANEIMPMMGSYHGGISKERVAEVRAKALEGLVDQAYKVRFALAEEISVENTAVDAEVEPIRAKFESQKDFETALGGEGLAGYRASVYRKLLAAKAEEVAVESKVMVSDEEVRAHYDNNKHRYMRPKRFKPSQIYVKVDPSSNKEERAALLQRAEGLASRAKDGEDFYNLAYYNSDDKTKYVGGDLGYVHKGRLVPEFEEQILQMEEGDIIGPIKSRFGYHVVKMVKVDEPKQLSFEETRDTIRKDLEQEQRDALYAAWMEGMKSQYQVQRFND